MNLRHFASTWKLKSGAILKPESGGEVAHSPLHCCHHRIQPRPHQQPRRCNYKVAETAVCALHFGLLARHRLQCRNQHEPPIFPARPSPPPRSQRRSQTRLPISSCLCFFGPLPPNPPFLHIHSLSIFTQSF